MSALLLFAAITDIWAGLPTHPAVVNPVSYEAFGRPAEVISLSGEWDFKTASHGSGIRSVRFDKDIWKDGARRIRVPAVWEAEGVGERGMGIPYLCADNAPKELRHVFAGEGWYRRTVEVPAGWRGKRVWLKAGGVRSQGWFCVTNEWPVWFFPRRPAASEPENVVVAAYGSPAAEQARKDGRNLLLIANQDGRSNFLMGWWNIGAQCGTAVLPHPVLGDFPADPFLSPLFFRIIKEGLKLLIEGFSERDYVMVGEGLRDAYLYLAAKERPDGSREVLVADLDISGTVIEGASLRANVLSWLSKGEVRQGLHQGGTRR